jgi:DNA-binding MarR family transcriptional regulator
MDTQQAAAGQATPGGQPGDDAIAVIELELMKLVRHLETFGRRCSLYVRVDRAGYLAMRMLDALGPVNTNTLAHALHLDASTVTRQVTALEGQGFVERHANPADGRSSTIALTRHGHWSMRAVERERRRNIEALVSDWDSRQQIDLGVALTRLNDSLAASVTEPDDSRQRQDARSPASR